MVIDRSEILRLIKYIICIFFCFLTISCASPYKRIKSFSIFNYFNSDQIEIIVRVMDMWCEYDNRACVPVIISNKRKGGSIEPTNKGLACKDWRRGTTSLSAFHAPRIHICVHKLEGDMQKFEWVVAHEIGHALALNTDHPDYLQKGDIMWERPAASGFDLEKPTENDLWYVGAN